MPRLYALVLSGGAGTRLWPMSRKLLPKQFLPLVSEASLFQDTVTRVTPIEGCLRPIVVCNDEQRFLAAEQLRSIGIVPQLMLLEPVGRAVRASAEEVRANPRSRSATLRIAERTEAPWRN